MNGVYITEISGSAVIARNEALIFPGGKLNALFAAQRMNYKDVIHNLLMMIYAAKNCRANAHNDRKYGLIKYHSGQSS